MAHRRNARNRSAGGKDGTIRHVFEGVNPQGVTVASFKVPTQEVNLDRVVIR